MRIHNVLFEHIRRSIRMHPSTFLTCFLWMFWHYLGRAICWFLHKKAVCLKETRNVDYLAFFFFPKDLCLTFSWISQWEMERDHCSERVISFVIQERGFLFIYLFLFQHSSDSFWQQGSILSCCKPHDFSLCFPSICGSEIYLCYITTYTKSLAMSNSTVPEKHTERKNFNSISWSFLLPDRSMHNEEEVKSLITHANAVFLVSGSFVK